MHKSDTRVIIMETEFILRTELTCNLPASLLGLTTERTCHSEVCNWVHISSYTFNKCKLKSDFSVTQSN